MPSLSLADLKRLFYAGESDEELQFLKDANARGIRAGDLLNATSLLASVHDVAGAPVAATSASFVDVDATNLAATFTVPASGAVLVRVTARINVANANSYDWNLREGAADVAGTAQLVLYHDAGGSIQIRTTAVWKLTGLTPGASKTYKLGHARSFGTGTTDIRRGATDPVTIEVWGVSGA